MMITIIIIIIIIIIITIINIIIFFIIIIIIIPKVLASFIDRIKPLQAKYPWQCMVVHDCCLTVDIILNLYKNLNCVY